MGQSTEKKKKKKTRLRHPLVPLKIIIREEIPLYDPRLSFRICHGLFALRLLASSHEPREGLTGIDFMQTSAPVSGKMLFYALLDFSDSIAMCPIMRYQQCIMVV